AAQRADAAAVSRLQQSVDRARPLLREPITHADASMDFHVELARAAGNEVLYATVEAYRELLVPSIRDLRDQKSGRATQKAYETDRSYDDVVGLADVVHDEKNLAASLASGTFLTAGMLVAPCSMRTMSAIANALDDNLIVRAADVHLKERRKLVLMVRETPLNANHLRLMHELALAGAVILPPVPGFYQKPTTL